MAKKPPVIPKILQPEETLSGGQGEGGKATGRTLPVGVGLKESEVRELDTIAVENDIARNALLRIAVHRFLDDYRAGRIDLTQYHRITTKKKLNF